MAYQTRYPSSVAQPSGSAQNRCPGIPSGASGCYDWVSLGNIKENDNKIAYIPPSGGVSVSRPSPLIICKNYGFNIPKNSEINGIEVIIDKRNNVSYHGIEDRQVKITLDGTRDSNSSNAANNDGLSNNWPTSSSSYRRSYYGGETSKWSIGNSLNPSTINSSNFGVIFQCTGTVSGNWCTPAIDFIAARVYYTAPSYSISSSITTSTVVGGDVTYTVTVNNTNGVHSGSIMNINVSIPSGFSLTGSTGTDSSSYNNGVWKITNFGSDNKATLTLKLKAITAGSRTISSTIVDNGKSTSSTISISNVTFSIENSTNKTQLYVDETFTYTATCKTNGFDAQKTVYIDSGDLVLVSQSGNGNYNPSNKTWNSIFSNKIANKQITFKATEPGTYLIKNWIDGATATTRTINVFARDDIKPPEPEDPNPPEPPEPEPPLPRENAQINIEDGTSVEIPYLVVTEGDNLFYPISNNNPEIDINPLELVSIISNGPKSAPPNTNGVYTVVVKNNKWESTGESIRNVRIDIGSDLDPEYLFDIILQKQETPIITSENYILISELKDQFKFNIEFRYDEVIQFNTIFYIFDEEVHSMPISIKDLAYVKMNIEGITEADINEEFELIYSLKNTSQIDATDVLSLIDIPKQFEILSIDGENYTTNAHSIEWYNDLIESESEEIYLKIKVKGDRRGTFRFKFSIDDGDVFLNEVYHLIDVGIYPITNIIPSINQRKLKINDTIVLTTKIKNNKKINKNTILTFGIDDYELIDIDFQDGVFDEENMKWYLGDISSGYESKITLTLKAKTIGEKIFTIKGYRGDNKLFQTKKVKTNVFEETPEFSFNVIQSTDIGYVDEEEYYEVEIKNLEDENLTNCFIENIIPSELEVLSSDNVNYDINTNTLFIDEIPNNDSIKFKINFKILEKGNFTTIFSFKADKTNIDYKILNIKCADEFIYENLRHSVKIFNFDKLNKYYNLRIDKNLIKVFNKENFSKKMIDIEKYLVDNVEVYEGGNLKEIVDDINENSAYVESKLMRTGLNNLKSKSYTIYPDGFIYRFGLLRSEIFHATGVIPKIINMSDYAMRWDVDNWNEKVWAGDIWDEGVFQVGIMYTDIPSNFIIPQNYELKAMINKTKPFGTEGIPYYIAREKFKIGMNLLSSTVEPRVYTELEKIRFKTPYCKMTASKWNEDLQDLELIYGSFDPIDFKLKFKMNAKFIGIDLDAIDKEPNVAIELNEKMRFKPLISKGINDIDSFKLNSIIDYKNSISNNNFKNIALNKQISLNDIEPENQADIVINIGEEPVLSFDNAPKYPIDEIFNSHDSLIVKLDFNIKDNTEFGLYMNDDNKYIRFCRNKNIINGKNGIKLSTNHFGMDEILYVNTLPEAEFIYLKVEQIDNMSLFYYSIDGLNFEYIDKFIMNFNSKKQGIYAINKNILSENIEYKCYEIKKMNTNTSQIYQSIQDDIKTIETNIKEIVEIKDELEWSEFDYINNDANSYGKCENNVIDSEQSVSPLIISFDEPDISDLDEIQKIDIKIKTQSNVNVNLNSSICINGNSYMPDEKGIQIKYPQNVNNLKVVKSNKTWQNIEGSIQSNLNNAYCSNQFGISATDWIEYKNFEFDIDGEHENTILNIEGVNKSNNNISCRIQMTGKNEFSKIYNIGNIQPGNFEKSIEISEVFNIDEINDNDFGFRIQFDNLRRDSKIELSKINSKLIYNKKTKTLPLFNEGIQKTIPKSNIAKWNLLSSNNFWNLKDKKPFNLSGNDVKNKIFAFIDFGKLNYSEYLRLYSVELIIYYKNTYGEFVSQTINNKVLRSIDNETGIIEAPIYQVLNDVRYETKKEEEEILDDVNVNSQSFKFKNKMSKLFTANSNTLSLIEFDARRSGVILPNNIKFSVYENITEGAGENTINKKGNLLEEKIISNWNYNNGIGSFDLNITLAEGDIYWFEMDLPKNEPKLYNISYTEDNIYISLCGNNDIIRGINANNSVIENLKYNISQSHQLPPVGFKIKIYNELNNRPNELLYEKEVNEWDIINENFGLVYISLDNLIINNNYWFELILPYSKENRYGVVWNNEELIISSLNEYNNMFGYGMDIKTDNIVIEQKEYDRPLIEVMGENNQEIIMRKEGIDFKHKIFQQFEAVSSDISAIKINTAGKTGFPSQYIALEILEDNGNNTPGRSIKKQYIEGWNGITNIKYRIDINDLIIGNKYWIKMSVPNLDSKNYYTLRYKEGNVYPQGRLLLQDGNKLININSGNASLSFKIYSGKEEKSLNKIPAFENFNDDINITNRLRRKNTNIQIKSYNTEVKYGKER